MKCGTMFLGSVGSYLLAFLAGVVGWLTTYFVGQPFLAYLKLRGEIARCLILYANLPQPSKAGDTLHPRVLDAREKYRWLASELVGVVNTIPYYAIWSFLGLMPNRKYLAEAKGNLMELSNSFGEPDRSQEMMRREENIRRLLRLR